MAELLPPADPHWPPAGAVPVEAACAVCGDPGPHPLAVSVGNPRAAGATQRFLRCQACGSLTAAGARLFEYTDDGAMRPSFWRHYLQVGAGIEFMVTPLERIRGARQGLSLLDVGCGFGYTLDYWSHVAGGTAMGVEPSEYGPAGKRLLGVDIHPCILSEATALRGRVFDVVYSCEVIEHVQDPRGFLRELAGYLAPGGTLALTTPYAGFVTPDAPPNMVISALSPGLHKLLFSVEALQQAIRDVGFAHVQVEVHRERLVAFASREPLRLTEDPAGVRIRYAEYLSKRAGEPKLDEDLTLGLHYRAMKELAHLGRAAAALPHAEAYEALVQARYGYAPSDGGTIRGLLTPMSDIESYVAAMPFSLGCFLYYRAMLCRLLGDPARAADLFALAEKVTAHSLSVVSDMFQEAGTLHWRAVFEAGSARLAAGDAAGAAADFARIPLDRAPAEGPLRFAILPPDLPPRIVLAGILAELRARRFGRAAAALARSFAQAGTRGPRLGTLSRTVLASLRQRTGSLVAGGVRRLSGRRPA